MPASLRLLYVVMLCIVTVAGVGVRVADLGDISFEPAEITSIRRAEALRFDGQPTLSSFTWATAASLRWGSDEAHLRLPHALIGALTIVILWVLGMRLFDAETALYAATALAVTPLHVAVSRVVGSDVWGILFATLTVLVFVWALEAPQRVPRWLVFAASAALASACTYRAILVLAALAVSTMVIAWRDPGLRRWLWRPIVAIVVVCAGVLAVASAHPEPVRGIFPRPRFDWTGVLSLITTGQPQQARLGYALLALSIFGMASYKRLRPTVVATTWLIIGVGGVWVGKWGDPAGVRPADFGFVVPAYLLLAAAGMTQLRRAVGGGAGRLVGIAAQAAGLACFLVIGVPNLTELRPQDQPSWRDAAAIVAANTLPKDVIVVLDEQEAFSFYAPDLESRLQPPVRPARASAYFVSAERGWLVASNRLRQLAGWKLLQRWMQRFPAVDLSPGADTAVYYMGLGGSDQQLFEAAHFKLPTATLVHGTLVLDWLQRIGPLPAVLWKVDQIALSREPLSFRNTSLLHAVYYLAEHGHADRAASLAYRLATAAPDWIEAREALAAFYDRRTVR